jgi:hypothetical protein
MFLLEPSANKTAAFRLAESYVLENSSATFVSGTRLYRLLCAVRVTETGAGRVKLTVANTLPKHVCTLIAPQTDVAPVTTLTTGGDVLADDTAMLPFSD